MKMVRQYMAGEHGLSPRQIIALGAAFLAVLAVLGVLVGASAWLLWRYGF